MQMIFCCCLIRLTANAMRVMLEICDEFAIDFDLNFNSSKSVATRIGKKVQCTMCPLYSQWRQSLKTCLEAGTCLDNENPCLEKSGSVLQFLQAYLCYFT